jgi:hypothetical protein
MDTATAGATVNIAGGTYFERLKMHVSGNASGGSITFQNLGYSATPGTPATVAGDTVIVDGTGANPAGDTLLDLTGANYVRVQGLQFANLSMAYNGRAILVGGTSTHVEILNNKIHHIIANGIYSSQSSIYPFFANGAGVTNLTVSGNEIYDCLTGYSEAMTITGASNWVIAYNSFHDLDAIVIDVGSTMGGPAAYNGTVRGNRIERLGPYSSFGLMSGENTTIKVGQAIYVQGGNHIVVERNTIDNATYGINVTAEAGYQPDDTIFVRDNDVSAISNLSGAITVGEWAGEGNVTSNVQVLGNTLHGNPFGLELLTATGVVVKDNVFFGNTTNVYNAYGAAMTLDYNLYSGGGVPAGDAHAVAAAAGFPNSVLINAGDPAFVLGPTYDGVAETDLAGHARVQGGRVDLGALELQ